MASRMPGRPAESRSPRTRAGWLRRGAAGPGTRKAKLSPADIAELASQMHVPEGTLRMVLSHYPELARPLARRRALVA